MVLPLETARGRMGPWTRAKRRWRTHTERMDGGVILRFLGAAGTVTGSRFLVETSEARVLVDCGLFQGRKELRLRNWAPFPVDPSSVDAIVVTHAHIDHLGFLPALVRDGFRGRVLCTPATAALATIVLEDAARLQEEEAEYANRKGYSKHHPALPLYTGDDAARALELLRPVVFGHGTEPAPGVEVVLRPAGHILGAATAELFFADADRAILFTGDLGRPVHPLLRPPEPPAAADVIVTESTYGNRRHADEIQGIELLASVISRTAAKGGSVVIPAFAVDRTEVVLMTLRRLTDEGLIPRLPVYADSPMALAVLDVYRKAIVDGSPEIREDITEDPFGDVGDLHEVPTSEGSRKLNDLDYPSIIVSASGMATGGRVLHHLANRLPDPRNAVVLVGFQAPGTRGQLLASGARSLKMLGRYVPVRAEVVELGCFSVHADADELVGWLGSGPVPPDVAYVVHGEPMANDALCGRLTSELEWNAVVPAHDERVRVD